MTRKPLPPSIRAALAERASPMSHYTSPPQAPRPAPGPPTREWWEDQPQFDNHKPGE